MQPGGLPMHLGTLCYRLHREVAKGGGTRMILLGCSCFAFNLSETIAERNAFNCECERHDLLACKMQGP